MGSPAQSRSRAAQSMFSPLSVTREREKTDEGEAQTETEAPERPQNLISSLLRVTGDRERKEGARASQRSPERQRREIPDGSSGEAPESDFFLITRNRRQREEGGGQSQPEEPRRPDDKERLRGSPGEGAPEQVEEGEAQKEAPERSRSRLGLVFQ